jgi:hypothetical protein
MRLVLVICLVMALAPLPSAGQESAAAAERKVFDSILDQYVRDGLVYYRALKAERGRLDRYVASLAEASIDAAPREERLAFWLNAYNAIVLQTVITHYPITRQSKEYPERSIRQIPGAFERLPHRVARRMLTLDQIELTMLAPFKDPRVYFGISRGAVGGGRLRSEAFTPELVDMQLAAAAGECVTRAQCVELNRAANRLTISSIFSWRSADFIAAYADAAPSRFATRSPIERAALAFVAPKLLTIEKELVDKNEFTIAFKPFDWSLNDLTGRGGR